MEYPSLEEEQRILKSNITVKKYDEFDIKPVLAPDTLIKIQNLLNQLQLNDKVERYIIRLVDATRHPQKYNLDYGKYVGFGGSPRLSIGLYIASKSHALVAGRTRVTPQDVKDVAYNVMRHRILLNFEGEAEGIRTDDIIAELLKKVPII